ncbi:MAG: hypothetical protein OXS30_02460 [Chloroflexota bacterium]|nr:hypothetical protein [Chloroflexota bacterium]
MQHPRDGLRRHDLQQRLTAGAWQSSEDQTDVGGMQLAQSLPGSRFVAGSDQVLDALGDPPDFLQRDRRGQLCRRLCLRDRLSAWFSI